MTDRELMQQALEALEVLDRVVLGTRRAEETIAALRERLAQPEQEPVAWMYESTCGQDFATPFEPPIYAKNVRPLYTTPPTAQRQWVGLTDEEIMQAERLASIRHLKHRYSIRGQQITPADDFQWHYARAIEEALKRKNT